jgi:hypothetical protein
MPDDGSTDRQKEKEMLFRLVTVEELRAKCTKKPSIDDEKIAFLGYTPNELQQMKQRGELDHEFPLTFLLSAGTGISYVALHLQDCLIIALTDDGQVGFGSFCAMRSYGPSDYTKEVISKLVSQRVSEVDAQKILRESYNRKPVSP